MNVFVYLFLILLYSQNQSSSQSPGIAQNLLWHHKEPFCFILTPSEQRSKHNKERMDYDSKPDTIMVCVQLLESVLYDFGGEKKLNTTSFPKQII